MHKSSQVKGIKILKVAEDYIPFLSETETLEKFPNVTVDMGAVRFMCKGANLMRPGIKSFTDFGKRKLVCIVEESQHKFLAIGKAMVDSSELENMEKGEVLKKPTLYFRQVLGNRKNDLRLGRYFISSVNSSVPSLVIIRTSKPSPLAESLREAERTARFAKSTASSFVIFGLN